MPHKPKAKLALITLYALAWSVIGRGDSKQTVEGQDSDHAVSLCEVLTSPDRYNNKTETVRATYRVDFEASELCCLACSRKSVGVEFDETAHGDKPGKALLRLLHHGSGTVNGVFTGVFQVGGSDGHLGHYRNRLLVESVSHLAFVDRLGLAPSRLNAESRKRVCQ